MQGASFDRIREIVRERSAIVLEPGKEYLVEARLQPLVNALGLASIDELCVRLSTSAELVGEVVEAMTTNETSFFRDLHPFETLKTEVLPAVIRKRAQSKTLRIWSAACSTGQEPYSIALLFNECFPELVGWDIRIVATDISANVLKRARAGRYRQLEVNRGLPVTYLVKYFDRHGLDWEVKQEVKRMVEFSELNLVQNWRGLPCFDVVFMRNVLIYFDVQTKQEILQRMRNHLTPGGFLFLGGAETTVNLDHAFERAPFDRASCYRFTARAGGDHG